CPSLTKDGSLHLVPGRYKLPTAPGASWRKDGPGWEKAENKFTARPQAYPCVCVCVCPVAPPYMHVCVVCAIKNLTKVLIIIKVTKMFCIFNIKSFEKCL